MTVHVLRFWKKDRWSCLFLFRRNYFESWPFISTREKMMPTFENALWIWLRQYRHMSQAIGNVSSWHTAVDNVDEITRLLSHMRRYGITLMHLTVSSANSHSALQSFSWANTNLSMTEAVGVNESIWDHLTDSVQIVDCGDYVVVTNSKQVKVSGRKSDQLLFRKHTLYPGGLKETPYKDMMERHPDHVRIASDSWYKTLTHKGR